MRKLFTVALTLTALGASAQNLVQYVHPIIGTQRMGHTFPGATAPFGMVQLSPETDTISYEQDGHYNPKMYEYCAGYQYDDKTIVGFSHTHFSGTGHSDLGDFLIMPTTGALRLNPGTATEPGSGFRSRFSHDNETAEADYYRVKLEDYNILAELTATTRVGVHRYTFPAADQAHIILDLMYGIYNYDDKNVWTYLRVVNDTLVEGYRETSGWARTRTLYFALTFSRPFTSYGNRNYTRRTAYHGFWGKFNQGSNFPEVAGRQIRAFFNFGGTRAGDAIVLKMALSPVSMDNALQNLRAEAPGWDFDAIKAAGQSAWNQQLSRIAIDGADSDKVNFYTSEYHAFINPTIYQDINGQYKGLDKEVHTADGFTNYTTFSLWDTHRALHPLFNLIEPARNADMVRSMLEHFHQSPEHMLPIWSNSANENWCMTGYHSVSVICDAIVKGIGSFDRSAALDACVTTARHRDYDGIGDYIDRGYIPTDKNGNGVSTTLEYAYDDWCIAQAARKLGRSDIYDEFLKRSLNYRNVWDPSIGFMRPRLSDGTFRVAFDPLSTINEGFIEGNSWNYSLYVPHDPAGLIALMGGNKRFVPHLDSLFTMDLPDKYFAETEDITRDGIIGNYVHGNEPSHHDIYLYDFTNEPWKAQALIRMVMWRMYKPTPDGLGGNDDTGQMSAWYIFSALGFYPVSPGDDKYWLGSPSVRSAVLSVTGGKKFTVSTVNQGPLNVYVQKVSLNGAPLHRLYITYDEITAGGTLEFTMGAKPNKHIGQ
ncbi:MAG TPA: GH92 family glycosyl hydrolase [Dinghuibacter sp.]|uniref:GH92 family glycosyl hydrolase n=1 Tax=Dinghuibacter sp. TaxID=2024697 RepID=UPI002C5E47A6|nr:GH92 family glycosyl hydrolase [Dinghuibacter sp.]HTJ13165.1 GH92 family glycosyl hydrolase [Dinghuibacter sp.]